MGWVDLDIFNHIYRLAKPILQNSHPSQAAELGKHWNAQNKSSPSPGLRPDGTPCIQVRNKTTFSLFSLSKVKRFLCTLIQFGTEISAETGEKVKELVFNLVVSCACQGVYQNKCAIW